MASEDRVAASVDNCITLSREDVGYCIDAVAMLTRANDVDNPYPALLRRLQEAYRIETHTAFNHALTMRDREGLSEPGNPPSGGGAREGGRPNTSTQASTPGSLSPSAATCRLHGPDFSAGCPACLVTPHFAWLIERGQPERQEPTVWWAGDVNVGWGGWTPDAWKAVHYETKEQAEEDIRRRFTDPRPSRGASARAVEHGFHTDDPTCEGVAASVYPREWALFLGERIVTTYETKEEAAEALSWYVDTYGSAKLTDALNIGEVDAKP